MEEAAQKKCALPMSLRPVDASPSRPRAIVIGSGFGGLAAAIRLLARGYAVSIFEKQKSPGGRAGVVRKNGFTFDTGPTVITAPHLLRELWELLGENMDHDIELRPVDPYYAVRFSDGSSFDYCGDKEKMRRQIERLEPKDVEGYERFLKMSRRIFETGFDRLADVPFHSFWSMAKIAPAMMRLRSYQTVYRMVASYVKNEQLRQVLSFHTLLVGGNPFSTTSIYALISYLERKWGVHYAMGGTAAVISAMVKLFERHGGNLALGTEVAEIAVSRGRARGVHTCEGTFHEADIVVSNADAAYTYRHMIQKTDRFRWSDERLGRLHYAMSVFVWYFGTNRVYDDVAHHTIVLGPRYKELLEDIFERKILAEDFSLYVHRPTATDRSVAPPGCDTFYALSPVPNLKSGIDWQSRAESYRDAIAQTLEDSLLPDLRRSVISSFWVTPEHFRDEMLSVEGSAFGFEPRFTQSAYFRPHNRSEDIDGLYLVGAGTHPGAGLPGVLSSAKVLERIVPHVDLRATVGA